MRVNRLTIALLGAMIGSVLMALWITTARADAARVSIKTEVINDLKSFDR